VEHAAGEAKLWLEPTVSLADNYGLSSRRVGRVLALAEEHRDEILSAWEAHFGC
jgi:hypothetical protein